MSVRKARQNLRRWTQYMDRYRGKECPVPWGLLRVANRLKRMRRPT